MHVAIFRRPRHLPEASQEAVAEARVKVVVVQAAD